MKANYKDYIKHMIDKYYMKDITGAKVKLNVDKLLSRGCSEKFKHFLEESKDKEFTAILDVDMKYTTMYVLKEDTSPVKWLFHIEDLILVK